MTYSKNKKQKPIVRFRTNGGGIFVHTGVQWVRADAEIMTNVAETLYKMVRFSSKS